MSDIVNIKVYENTPEGMQAAITAVENRLDQKIDDALIDSVAIGDPTIPIPVDVTGNAHCLGVGPGTYANWGGLVVPDNNTATLRRVGGSFSMSLTTVSLTDYALKTEVIEASRSLSEVPVAYGVASANGAIYNANDKLTIPIGSTGNNSQLQLLSLDSTLYVGQKQKLIFNLIITNYAELVGTDWITLIKFANGVQTGFTDGTSKTITETIDGTTLHRKIEIEVDIVAQDLIDITSYRLLNFINNSHLVTQEVTITVVGKFLKTKNNTTLLVEHSEKLKEVPMIKNQLANSIGINGLTNEIHLKKSYFGAGLGTSWFNNWNDLQDKIDSINDNTVDNQYTIFIHDDWELVSRSALNGDITTDSTAYAYILKTKDFVNVKGFGGKRYVKLSMPQASSSNDVLHTQPALIHGTTIIEDLVFIGHNCRYAMHTDSEDRGENENAVQYFNNCGFIGKKRTAAYAGAVAALGIGCSSGHKMYFKNCKVESDTTTIIYHTNKDFDYPTILRFKNCQIASNVGGNWMDLTLLGQNQTTLIELYGNDIQGQLNIKNEWYTSVNRNDCRTQTPLIVGSGNTPFHTIGQTKAKVLRFDAVDFSEVVTVEGGTYVEQLFGNQTKKDGCSDLKGFSYGSIDIADDAAVGTSLGARLGNCTVVNKTIGITIGSDFRVMTFSNNYTAMTNATIIAEINSSLSGYATCSEYNITANYHPELSDIMLLKTCTSTTASIKRKDAGGMKIGTIVVEDSLTGIRPATQFDSKNLLFCLDDIQYSGQTKENDIGRCVKNAVFYSWWSFTAFYGSVAVGDKFEIDSANDGILVKNNSSTRVVAIGVAENVIKMI